MIRHSIWTHPALRRLIFFIPEKKPNEFIIARNYDTEGGKKMGIYHGKSSFDVELAKRYKSQIRANKLYNGSPRIAIPAPISISSQNII